MDEEIKITDAFDAKLAAEDGDIDQLDAQMRAEDSGNTDHDTNSNAAETHADSTGDTQVIDGNSKEVKAEGEVAESEAEEQEAQAEVQAEVKPDEQQAKPKIRPWSELRKTKKERDQLVAEKADSDRRLRALEDRYKILESKVAPVDQSDANKVPEFTKDPLGHLKGGVDRTEQELGQMRQMLQAQQLQAEINADEANFTKDHPDYTDARDWLLEQEYKDAQIIFRALPEEQRNQYAAAMVNQRRGILIATAKQTNRSVAELAYEVATSRGHAPKVANVEVTNVAKNESKATPEAAKERVVAAKAREGQAGASLSSVGQSPGVKKAISREDILNMSEAEMDKLAQSNEDWSDQVQQ